MQTTPSRDQFEEEQRAATNRLVRRICGGFSVVFVLWGAFDLLVQPARFEGFLGLRGAGVVASLAGIAFGWRQSRAFAGFAIWLFGMAAPVALMLALVDDEALVPYVVGFCMFFVGGGLLPRWPARFAVANQLGLLALAVSGIAARPSLDANVLVPCVFVIGTIVLVTLVIPLLQERSGWQTFLTRKSLEAEKQETERLRAVAEASDRAKSAFLANMSHELRTPLNVIVGYTQLLREDLGPHDADRDADLARIEAAGIYLVRLVSDVLDLSKVAAGQLQVTVAELDPGTLLDDLAPLARALCEQNDNRFVAAWSDDVPRCRADPIRIRQILLNLLSNAAKFTRRGTVTVRTEHDSVELRICVVDTGIGIAEEQLEQLFQPFVQVHTERHADFGGTGLGLSLSRELARMMDGDVTVRSARGAGSRFTLHVPLVTRPA
ncbi:MAG: ATP-binding protein [Myxococcota bacterium]